MRTGLYGDLAGILETTAAGLNGVLIALEWADLDPRLGWREFEPNSEVILDDAQALLDRIANAIELLTAAVPVALSLPTIPVPPAFVTASSELHRIEAKLHEIVYRFAGSTRAAIAHPGNLSFAGHDLRSELMNGSPILLPTLTAERTFSSARSSRPF